MNHARPFDRGGGRRSAEERAKARALGVDRNGRPTARALGINPRALRRGQVPEWAEGMTSTELAEFVEWAYELDAGTLARLSRRLLEQHQASLSTSALPGSDDSETDTVSGTRTGS